ncbi:MAG: OmpH family outer membrane protein [Myxococcales bacterium]|nr:OmpH family outer membrane protein [Myxococcales bacterium]
MHRTRSALPTKLPRTARFGRRLGALLVSGAVLTAGMALAPMSVAQAAVPQVRKIATVDMQRVLNETKHGKKERKKLEASSKAKQQKLDQKRRTLEQEQAKLAQLKGQELAKAQEKLQQDLLELQQVYMTMQQELAASEGRVLEDIYKKSQGIISKLASELELDLVIVSDPSVLIYQKKGIDITAELVKRYNTQHP